MARHFYAGGERHTLEPAVEWLAIDTLAAAGLESEVAALPVESRLPGGIILVDRGVCPDELEARAMLPGPRARRTVRAAPWWS